MKQHCKISDLFRNLKLKIKKKKQQKKNKLDEYKKREKFGKK